MAKLVVLRFEDDEEADLFAKGVFPNGVHANVERKDGYIVHEPTFPTIEGLFQTPTKFCECVDRSDGYYRGRNHGWWLHGVCGRPTVMWGENFRAVIIEGHNQLERESANSKQFEDRLPQEGTTDHEYDPV